MSSELVLEVGSEGGSICLLREDGRHGLRFWMTTDETGTVQSLSEEDQQGLSPSSSSQSVSTFDEALKQFDRYPWTELFPLFVHEQYRQEVMTAVRNRVGPTNSEESSALLARWMSVLGENVIDDDAPERNLNSDIIS